MKCTLEFTKGGNIPDDIIDPIVFGRVIGYNRVICGEAYHHNEKWYFAAFVALNEDVRADDEIVEILAWARMPKWEDVNA